MMISLRKVQRWLLCVGGLLFGIAQTAPLTSADEFVSPHGMFRVDMGAKPTEVVRPSGKDRFQFQFSVTTPEGTKMVNYTDHRESFEDGGRSEKFLDEYKVMFVRMLGAENIQKKPVTQSGRTGYEFQFVSAKLGGNVRWRLFFVGKREYGLMAIGKKDVVDHPRTSAFLDSFTVLTEAREATTEFLPFIDEAANFATLTFPSVVALPQKSLGDSDKPMTVFAARGGKGIYGILYQHIPGLKSGDARRIDEVTRKAVNALTEGHADLLTQKGSQNIKQSGVEAREIDYQAERTGGMLRQRVIVHGERVYSLMVAGAPALFDTKRPAEFLDAFRLLRTHSVEKEEASTPPPAGKKPEPEGPAAKKPANVDKPAREKAIQQLKDF